MADGTLSEVMLNLKANFAKQYRESRGNMDGFASAWAQAEPDMLVAGQSILRDAQTKSQARKDEAARMNLRRSQMSIQDKVDFVGQYGLEAYRELGE